MPSVVPSSNSEAKGTCQRTLSKVLEEKVDVPDENDEIFMNSLALELATAERTSLKKIIIEVGDRPVGWYDALNSNEDRHLTD